MTQYAFIGNEKFKGTVFVHTDGSIRFQKTDGSLKYRHTDFHEEREAWLLTFGRFGQFRLPKRWNQEVSGLIYASEMLARHRAEREEKNRSRKGTVVAVTTDPVEGDGNATLKPIRQNRRRGEAVPVSDDEQIPVEIILARPTPKAQVQKRIEEARQHMRDLAGFRTYKLNNHKVVKQAMDEALEESGFAEATIEELRMHAAHVGIQTEGLKKSQLLMELGKSLLRQQTAA